MGYHILQEKALSWLRNWVLASLAAAFAGGIMLPVYTDEIGWRFQERAGFDGVDKMFSDLCGANMLALPPFFMWPARIFSSTLNAAFADPLYVRISGILYALAWLLLLLMLLRRIGRSSTDAAALGLCGLGLMALGNQPLLLIMSRPEQPILLVTTIALLLAAKGWDDTVTSPRTAWWRSLAVLALAIVAMSYHLKGLFLLPVFLGCLFYASRGSAANIPRLATAGVLLAVTAVSLHYWMARLQCPGDPVLRMQYARNNVGAILTTLKGPGDLLPIAERLFGNLSLFGYIALAAPKTVPLSAWLPVGQIDSAGSARWSTFLDIAWGAAMAGAVLALILVAWQCWRQRRIEPRAVLSLLLLSTMLGWSATQLIRNVYEASFALPVLMLALVFALAAPVKARWAIVGHRLLATGIGLCALGSVPLIAMLWGPSLLHSAGQRGYIAEQPYSVPVFGYSAVRPDIMTAAKLCSISEPRRAKGLMIDELTYFPFMEAKLPQHRLGVLGVWRGSIDNPVAYLRSLGSDGAILGCHLLSPDLRARAKRHGMFCCLGPPNW